MLKQNDPELLASAISEISSHLEESTAYPVDDETKVRLIELLSHNNEEIRENASYIFQMLADRREILDQPLMQLLLDKLKAQEKGSDQIVYLIGLFGGPIHIPPLMDAMSSNKNELRLAIINTLGRIGHENALPGLFKALESKDDDIRESIIEAIGKINHKDALDPLISALSDKNERVRYEAAIALGELKDIRAFEPFIDYLRVHGASKWTLRALEKLADRRVIPFLVDGLANSKFYDDAAVQAMHMLRELDAENEAFEGLILTAQNKDIDNLTRITAISSLGTTKNKKASAILSGFVNNKNESSLIRCYAIKALGDLKDTQTIPLLRAIAFGEYSSKVPMSEKLAKLGSPDAAELLKTIREDRDASLVEEAVLALGKVEDIESLKFIVDLLQDNRTPENILKSAIQALGFLGKKEAIEPLVELLKSNNRHTKQLVIKALGQINNDLAIPALTSVLRNDSDHYVRSSSAEALGRSNDRNLAPVFLEALNDPEYSVRKACKVALIEVSDTELINQYIQILNDEEAPIKSRKELTGVLSHFNQAEGIQALLKESLNEESKIRNDAIAALGVLKATRAADTLLELSNTDKDESTRLAAMVALAKIGNEDVIPNLVKTAESDHSDSIILALCTFKNDPRAAQALTHISMHAQRVSTRQKTRCV